MTPTPDVDKVFTLAFLTDQWAWEQWIDAPDQDQATAVAKAALETLVREEAPALACVRLLLGERRLGVWDWVDGQAVWTVQT